MSVDDRVIRHIYDGVEDGADWNAIAAEIGDAFGGAIVSLDWNASVGPADALIATRGFDLDVGMRHFEEFCTPDRNIGMAQMLRAPVREAFTMRSFVSPEVYDRDPATRAILAPQRIDRGVHCVIARGARQLTYVNVFRTRSGAEFDAIDVERLSLISQHLERALRMRRHRITAELALLGGASMKPGARGETGLMIVEAGGRVVHADHAVARMIDEGIGLAFGHADRIVSLSRQPGQDTASLNEFLGSADAHVFPIAVEPDGFVVLRRVGSLPSLLPGIPTRIVLSVAVIRIDTPDLPAAFAAAYELTAAESRQSQRCFAPERRPPPHASSGSAPTL